MKNESSSSKPGASIDIYDDNIKEVINPNAKIEILSKGHTWTEGPLWIDKGQYLLFSDIPNNIINKLRLDGSIEEYLNPSGYTGSKPRGGELGSNALLLDKEENLVLMQHGDRRVARMNSNIDQPSSNFTTIVGDYQGKKLNSPNDGTFDSLGNLYFTDPPYGLERMEKDTSKELSFQGVYFVEHGINIKLLDSTISKPNGIGLSKDEKTLYVAVSDPKHAVWYQFDIEKPGSIANKRIFYDASSLVGMKGEQGLPDGFKIHSSGNLFATGPGGVWIFNPKGKPMAKIRTGEATSNCAFSADESMLFITADSYILKVKLK